MNSIEDQVRAATRAEASTMREVRPLRLPPDGSPRPAVRSRVAARWPRRWQLWLAPVTAAAVVVALAVSLVAIRDNSNGRVVPATGPAPAAGSVPKYYVTLYTPRSAKASVPCKIGSVNCTSGPPTELLVGNTLTGATVAIVPPPKDTTFNGLTGAADDRTFVVDTYTTSPASGGSCFARTFYLLKIAPGTSSPAALTKLRIPHLACVDAIALSGSGRELAVAGFQQHGNRSQLQIYSVATGQLLRSWSTGNRAVFDTGANVEYDQNTGLSWADGDHELAFPSIWESSAQHETMRVLDVAAGGSDLISDSRVIWSMANSTPDPDPPGCQWYESPMLTADGKSVVCLSVDAPISLLITQQSLPASRIVPWRLAWLEYSTSDPKAAPRALYEVTIDAPAKSGFWIGELWTNASGSTVIGYRSGSNGHAAKPEFYGAISDAGIRPLPTPSTVSVFSPVAIAW